MKKQTKTKNLLIAIIALAVTVGTTSCKKDVIGSGPVTTETRALPEFTAIDLQMNGNVFYKQDSVWKVEITARQSIHPILQTSVSNHALIIRYNSGHTYDNDESIRINVSGPGVSKFLLNTSGNIYSNSDINTTNLVLRSSGSGNIALQRVTAASIDAESTQSGVISATIGTANTENLKTDGSGTINIPGIVANTVTAKIVGSGNIQVAATQLLDATIQGSGSVYFTGHPAITSHVSGIGRIIRL